MIIDRVKNCFFVLYNFFETNKIFNSIKRAFCLLIPVFLSGSIALIILNLPITPIRDWIQSVFNGSLSNILQFIYQGTFGISSLYILITLPYIYSKNILKIENKTISLLSTITAIASFVASLGITNLFDANGSSFNTLLIDNLNVQSIFGALITSIIATRLFVLLVELNYKRKKNNLKVSNEFNSTSTAILPMFFVILLFALINKFLIHILKVDSFNHLLVKIINPLFKKTGASFAGALLVTFFQTFLWFFGIHGSNTLENTNMTFYSEAGSGMLSKPFFETFVFIGGCGTTICLLIALILFSKSKAQKDLTKNATLPAIFNINENILFGLPLVLNPIYFIPFILTPIATLTISFIATKLNIVPIVSKNVFWTTPVFANGYISVQSISGIFLQLINITVGVLIYMPFVKISNRFNEMEYKSTINEMISIMKDAEKYGEECSFYNQKYYISNLAKEIGLKLRDSIQKKELNLFYQPQIDSNGNVISCEALLRWAYKDNEFLYPPLVIAISKEENIYEQLTDVIIDKTIQDTLILNSIYGSNLCVSINIQTFQFTDIKFINRLIRKLKQNNIIPYTYGIEITEETVLKETEDLDYIFKILHENNVIISLDDFTMGHTSLKYLQKNSFDFVKIDGNLIKDMTTNSRSQDIIKSVTNLGKTLDFKTVAEYVETKQQRDILLEVGCGYYQGYLYSPAIPFNELLNYINDNKKV